MKSASLVLSKFHPDEIRATKISSRLNKGNKDLTGQVGQVGQADLKIFNPDEIGFAPEK